MPVLERYYSTTVHTNYCIVLLWLCVTEVSVCLCSAGMSDWDLMMQKRKEAMARARKRRKRDIDITAVDDHIIAMIREMRKAVEVSCSGQG